MFENGSNKNIATWANPYSLIVYYDVSRVHFEWIIQMIALPYLLSSLLLVLFQKEAIVYGAATIELGYENWNSEDILKAVFPHDLPNVTGFSVVGHIAHLNLKDSHSPYKSVIGWCYKILFTSEDQSVGCLAAGNCQVEIP